MRLGIKSWLDTHWELFPSLFTNTTSMGSKMYSEQNAHLHNNNYTITINQATLLMKMSYILQRKLKAYESNKSDI